MTAAAPPSPLSSAPAGHRAGDSWRVGPLCDREARPVLLEPSYPDLLPQVFREEAKPVWLSTSVIGGDHCRRFYASVFRRAVEGVGHAQAQGPAWPSAVALVSVFRPGHRDPLPDLCASMLRDRWEGVQKPWEKSHAG